MWWVGRQGKAVASNTQCLPALKHALRNSPADAQVVVGWNGDAPDNSDVPLAPHSGGSVADFLAV
jgi:hypothetical protein